MVTESANTVSAQPATRGAQLPSRIEWLILAGIVVVGAWLRFQHPELLEFKSDEAFAANQALEFVRGGKLPTSGLMSSVGVSNPPLFIWLLIPMFFLTSNIAVVCGMISALGLAAVVATWWIGRRYYGSVSGLVAAALFASGPWAVVYSRKIWAQDFVPVLATGTMWAAHSLILGKNPKAIFWLLCLPLCVIQIHYSGFALTASAIVVVVLLRPRIDWRFAVAGVALAIALALPYVIAQQKSGWAEWKRMSEEGSGRHWEQLPRGMTINPQSGYPFPRRPTEAWRHALAIMNAGEIEDILGLSTSEAFDPNRVWASKCSGQNRYFDTRLYIGGLAAGAATTGISHRAGVVWREGLEISENRVSPPSDNGRGIKEGVDTGIVGCRSARRISCGRALDISIVLRHSVSGLFRGPWGARSTGCSAKDPGGGNRSLHRR